MTGAENEPAGPPRARLPRSARASRSGSPPPGTPARFAQPTGVPPSSPTPIPSVLLEVLAQHRHLALVVGAQVRAVEALGRRAGALQRQLADRLAVFDHERDVARPHLERGAAAVATARRVVAEARVEEAGVVGAQLARRRVVGHHLGGDLRRDADALGREQQVEDLRLEHDPPARLGIDRVPVVGPAVGADPREVDRQAVLLRPVADDPVARPGEVDAEEEAIGKRQLGLAQRLRVEVEQRELVLQGADLGVAEAHLAARQAQLVEREAAAHLDREGARHHLQVELAAVAGADLVEAVVAIGEHPGEDVEAAGRALRVRLGAHVVGQRQLLQQRHQVGTVALQHRAVAQVDFLEGEPLDLLLDRRVDIGQEAAAQRPRMVAEAQVDAGGLDRLGQDPVIARAQPAGLDRPAQRLRWEDSGARHGHALPRHAARRCRRVAHAAEIMRRASTGPT